MRHIKINEINKWIKRNRSFRLACGVWCFPSIFTFRKKESVERPMLCYGKTITLLRKTLVVLFYGPGRPFLSIGQKLIWRGKCKQTEININIDPYTTARECSYLFQSCCNIYRQDAKINLKVKLWYVLSLCTISLYWLYLHTSTN